MEQNDTLLQSTVFVRWKGEMVMLEKVRKISMAPYVSGGLLIINILIFLWCTFGGELLYNVGELSPQKFFEKKEYYRLIFSMFLHEDIGHLVNNMLLLFGLGAMIEKELGHITFAVAYFVTGIGGNLGSLIFKIYCGQWNVGSIGASGAVFGLIGVLLALAFFSGLELPNVTPARMILVVGYSVYSGMDNPGIDNAAHVSGLVAGILFGALLCVKIRMKNRDNNVHIGGYHED